MQMCMPNVHANAHAHANAYVNANAHAHANAHVNAHAHANAHSNAHVHTFRADVLARFTRRRSAPHQREAPLALEPTTTYSQKVT